MELPLSSKQKVGRMQRLIILILCGLVIGCGTEKKINKEKLKKDAQKKAWEQTCKTAKDTSLDEKKTIQKASVAIKRTNVNVKYKDCDAKEFKAQKESVKDASQFTLAFKSGFKNDKSQMRITVYNRTTCENGMFRALVSATQLEIPVAAEQSDRHMWLASDRDNYVDYEVQECAETNADTRCTKSETIEKGTVVVSVQLIEDQTEEVKELTVCRKPSQKK